MRLLLLVIIATMNCASALACEADSQPSRIVEKHLEQIDQYSPKQDDIVLLKELLANTESCADAYILNVTLSKILAYSPEEYANAAAHEHAAFATGWGSSEQRSERLLLAAQGYAYSEKYDQAIALYEQAVDRDYALPQRDLLLLISLYAEVMNYSKAAFWADEYLEAGNHVQSEYHRELFALAYVKTDQSEKAELFVEALVRPTPARRPSVLATYPKRASERGIEGECEVIFSVDEFGSPFGIKPTCTNDVFLEEAEKAVARAQFEIHVVDGSPRERHGVGQIITFELPD